MELTRDVVVALAKQLVINWQSIDGRVRQHYAAYDLSDEMKELIRHHMREAVGGEEVYKAACKVLADCGICVDCAGGGHELNPSPEVLDRALCTDSIPIPCSSCSGMGTTEDLSEE